MESCCNTKSEINSNSSITGLWTILAAQEIYNLPFPELIFRAQSEHRKHFDHTVIQRSTLLSIKTGGCPEDCAYCPQSAHYKTDVERQALLPVDEVLTAARAAKDSGSTRFCMGPLGVK